MVEKVITQLPLDGGPYLLLESPRTQQLLHEELIRSERSSIIVDPDGGLFEQTAAHKRAQGFKVLEIREGGDCIDPFTLLRAHVSLPRRIELMTSALLGVRAQSLEEGRSSLSWGLTSCALALTLCVEPHANIATLRTLLGDPTHLGERLHDLERVGLPRLTNHAQVVGEYLHTVPSNTQEACKRALGMTQGSYPDKTTCIYRGLHESGYSPTCVYLRAEGTTASQGALRMLLTGLLEGFGTQGCPGALFASRTHRIRRLYALETLLGAPHTPHRHVLLSARSLSTFTLAVGPKSAAMLEGLKGCVFVTPLPDNVLGDVSRLFGRERHAIGSLTSGRLVVLRR